MSTTNPLFDFKLVGDEASPFIGYNSASDKTRLKSGYLIRGSKNVYKKITGNIAWRCGIKRRGSIDATQAGVDSSTEWSTNLGLFRALRVANGKLQVESDIVTSGTPLWYDLLETSTLASPAANFSRFIFDTWWDDDDETDRLIMVRGDDVFLTWSGAMALVASATTNTITKQGSQTWGEIGFALSEVGEKKIVIDGREFTYTGGENTTTLTGVTASSGDASTLTSGMVAIQSVITFQNIPVDGYQADFLITAGNQIVIGSYSSRVVYMSADDKGGGFPDFTNAGAHVPGDPDILTLDNVAKGFGIKDGNLVVFAGETDIYEVQMNTNVTYSYTGTDGDTRFAYNKVTKRQLPNNNSALGHEFIGNIGDYLVWADQKNQLRALGSFTNSNFVKPTTLSLPVQTELAEDDFTGGHLRVIGDTVHITSPNNGRDWMFQIRETLNGDGSISSEKIWQPPQIRGLSRLAVIDGVLHGYSNSYPQLYQVDDTDQWFDDAPDGEEIPYSGVMRLAYNQHGHRTGLEAFERVYYEGYMAQGTPLYGNIYFDYQGGIANKASGGIRSFTISADSSNTKFWSNLVPPSLGDSSLGDNPLGDGILPEASDQETIPKFRAIVDVPQPLNFFEYCLEVYTIDLDARVEILCLGTNARLSTQVPTFLKP